jgi:hypothetical protein
MRTPVHACFYKAKSLSFILKVVHTRAATFRQQNRKTHQQWMYMLNRTFYERPTEGQKFFGTRKDSPYRSNRWNTSREGDGR